MKAEALSKGIPKVYSADCIGGLKQFVNEEHANMHVFREHVDIAGGVVRVPFGVPAAIERAKDLDLTGFLMDFTFKTNKNDLVLGVAGPVGLVTGTDGLPHMRFIPTVFMLSETEDSKAHQICYNLLRDLRHKFGNHRNKYEQN